ncbi:Rieske 2Fe-2S domain-containing protein [Variovorax sp. PCZ-1]|uniref:Rieske 2Fe-2S domain-containing protein n=1 Tax=Variovorax sp. PCZ-1 TaxID=2835533 RepID=UPI001BD0EBCF|nr:Rieske 2Fe-2S domain-containing protein [Variovorax sp. PCZ-1]MBS7808529.1 Rieske 2Fe-2S domain-containing protein [Variovorax sp. PCZ-1]
MNHEQNLRLTQVGPGTPGGQLQRRFWQPIALVEEFDPMLAPDMGSREHPRLIKAVRALGKDFVLVKNHDGTWALMDRDCPHRGANLAFARYESIYSQNNSTLRSIYAGKVPVLLEKSEERSVHTAIRCPFHGWAFQTSGKLAGQCIDTPAEPEGSTMCQHIKQRNYPVQEKAGVVWAWFGDAEPEPMPDLDCFAAPASHSFAFKGLWHANWLQCFEVGMDPAHPSFLHRFLQDADLQETGSNAGGKQFRSAAAGDVAGERWPMTRVMRELHRPKLAAQAVQSDTLQGIRITALRALSEQTTHVRMTQAIFPHIFVIPLSETLTITQWHLPVDDGHTYWFSVFTSFDAPIDQAAMRAQRLPYTTLPHYIPKAGAHNAWGFSPEEQATRTFLGMGEEDINVHDQWAVESMGGLQDRTREHLATSDKIIVLYRRWLQRAQDAAAAGQAPPPLPAALSLKEPPSTVDGFAPTASWEDWWKERVAEKRRKASWIKQ